MPDDGDGAKAVIDTIGFGRIEVPISDEGFDAAAHELAESNQGEGWDVGFVLVGLEQQPTEPTIVGYIVRVPGVSDPTEAAKVAQQALPDGALALGPCQTLRVMVHGYDAFGDED